jgi:hypothetical protein
MTTLAYDCLMTPRAIQRIVQRLTENGFLVRSSGCGRGKITGYKFIGLDVQKDDPKTTIAESSFTQTPITEAVKDDPLDENDDPPVHAIRKERVEPIREPVTPVPGWMPIASWEAFIEMRKKIPRAPLTARARQMVIKELDKLRLAGNDPAAVLDQSTMNGWRGVFPLKGTSHGKIRSTNALRGGHTDESRARYAKDADIVVA